MNVYHKAWVNVGNGTIPEIIEALRAVDIPSNARAVKIRDALEISKEREKLFFLEMKFVWDDER